jgi:uncharacterized lipoprotein NlpE involved in copper resistance
MKKGIFVVIAAVLLSLAAVSCKTAKDSSGNPPNWAGVYTGVTPAADAEGIDVKIALNADETYSLEYRYVGKDGESFTNTGKFGWNPEKNTVILEQEREGDFPKYYKLGENALIQLDLEGNAITGEFADKYVLKKQE